MSGARRAIFNELKTRVIRTACILHCALLVGCETSDPILPGARKPVFARDELVVLDKKIGDAGVPLVPEKCDFTIDGNNMIWKNGVRIFAGLPTESEIKTDKKTACHGDFVYAGLSTGELVKVNAKTRDLEWTADIFAERAPTGATPFLDIIATPVYNGGFIYAGGLGGAFCKIRDKDGEKIWCRPIAVQEITASTKKFNFVKSADGREFVISTDGAVYAADGQQAAAIGK
jgi:outer membrane protein assembly factor BamB